MAARKIKRKRTTGKAPVENTRSLWLASLGAVSIAQKRGGDLLAGLTAEGHDFQKRTQKAVAEMRSDTRAQVKSVFVPLRARLLRNANKAQATVQKGVSVVLARLGIPSKAAVEELSQRVAALSHRLRTAK